MNELEAHAVAANPSSEQSMNLGLAPVVMFAYSRPDHLRRAVASLLRNPECERTHIHFFCDGPKTPEVQGQVDAVRRCIESVRGFASVTRVYRDRNLGLAESVIDGVTRVVGQYGRVIVLEDDLILSPLFLRFMNAALDAYQTDAQVASIHGYCYPTRMPLPDTFFIRGADCWGWATWQRAWQHFEPNGQLLLDQLWDGWDRVAQQLHCAAVICNHALWDAALVAQVKALGLRALSYTVNDEWAAERLIALNTDVIIPAHWLKTISREGMGKGAFETLRAVPGNLFDQPDYQGAPILIAGDNFGCGSSHEHAAWALGDLGIRVVIAPSYSDIFSGNAVKNGILPVVLPQEAVDRLMEVAATDAIHVDLDTQTVTTPFQDRFTFDIDPFRKMCLLGGLDEISLTEKSEGAIGAHEDKIARTQPWLQPRAQ